MISASLPKFVFFTGKGGVGKTSLACATAVALADADRRVLLVSTDPASNVGQVFGLAIGDAIVAIPRVDGLEALEIDPERTAANYRERIIGPLRGTIPREDLRRVEEQLSGACTTEIATFDEFTRLLTDGDLLTRYDHVVFDTAPTGHTVRLLALPGAWSSFLEDGRGDASCLGPLAGLEQQRERYAAAVAALGDAERTLMVLVACPRRSALAEVARTSRELAAIGIENQHLAINGLMPAETGGDPLAAALRAKDESSLRELDPVLAALPRSEFPLRPFNLAGVEALRALEQTDRMHVDRRLADVVVSTSRGLESWPSLADLVDELEPSGKGLVMLMGKGGVGKTTVAAAIAIELAARGHDVHLTTTDPAAHLHETLAGDVDPLAISRIDPAAETERYRQHVLQTKGRNLDAAARALLEEDLRSPCTEEIAIFQAFSRTIREASHRFVVMDTAPTGHTLLLLDVTGSYHRDLLRHIGGDGAHVVTPMMRLQDPEQTRVLIVTLPEPTPVLEAARLQEDLRRAGIEPWAWVINASLAASATHDPLLVRRAVAERPQIEKIEAELSRRVAILPMLAEEPVGRDRLAALSARRPSGGASARAAGPLPEPGEPIPRARRKDPRCPCSNAI